MVTTDKLYERFFDPTEDFAEEPRAFCYDVATSFIKKAKDESKDNWMKNENTIKGILLLLFTWNFAAMKTKKLTFKKVRKALEKLSADLQFLEKYCITDEIDKEAWKRIGKTFTVFKNVFGQTGASKALSLLNPKLFVMWDTEIRTQLGKKLIPGIGNGETGEKYVLFLKGVQKIIRDYKIAEKLPASSIVAKKFDEYNYVSLVME